ncbi:MAG: hypothetical protein QW209_06395 [Nitrososphaerota archaeon]
MTLKKILLSIGLIAAGGVAIYLATRPPKPTPPTVTPPTVPTPPPPTVPAPPPVTPPTAPPAEKLEAEVEVVIS